MSWRLLDHLSSRTGSCDAAAAQKHSASDPRDLSQQQELAHNHTAQTSIDHMFAVLFLILMVITATIQGGANNLQPIRYTHTQADR